LAYNILAHLIENAASDANIIYRGRLAQAKLPMPSWFDSTCRALKAHLQRLAKLIESCGKKHTQANQGETCDQFD